MRVVTRPTLLVYVPARDEDSRWFALMSDALAYASSLETTYPGLHVYVCEPIWEHATATD